MVHHIKCTLEDGERTLESRRPRKILIGRSITKIVIGKKIDAMIECNIRTEKTNEWCNNHK
jgi:hypothetical protein